jgi:uncharacterized MAPEG superfamily protein
MTILQATLLGFALWTLAVLMFTVGVYRWSRILTGRSGIDEFSAEMRTGPDWYRRAGRAHANCIENLPVFTAVVAVASATGVKGMPIDALAIAVVCARVGQTVTHVAFTETQRTVGVRFSFFFAQVAAMIAMVIVVVSG